MKSQRKIGKYLKLPSRPIPKIMLPNKPYKGLLLYILDLIKLNPDHHNQTQWRCDTQFCFAGFTDLVVAYYFQFDFRMDNFYCSSEDYSLSFNNTNFLNNIRLKEIKLNKLLNATKGHHNCTKVKLNDVNNVETVARNVLGLSDNQVQALFYDSKCLLELERTVEQILTGKLK